MPAEANLRGAFLPAGGPIAPRLSHIEVERTASAAVAGQAAGSVVTVSAAGRRLGSFSSSKLFILFLVLCSFVLVLILYNWQRKRNFEEYNRFMDALKKKSPLLHRILSGIFSCLAFLIRGFVDILVRIWRPMYKYMDQIGEKRCPVRWEQMKRCTQHLLGACFYASARAVHAADNAADAEVVGRMKRGRAPKELKDAASEAITSWMPDDLTPVLGILEAASEYVDGKWKPFKELRSLVATELGRQIQDQLCLRQDFSAEAAYFLSKTQFNLGKSGVDESEYDCAVFFRGAGPMEHVSVVLDQIEKAGGSVTDSDHKYLKPVLESATRARVKWAMNQDCIQSIQYALFCAGTLRALDLPQVVKAGERYKALLDLPQDWDAVRMANPAKYGCRMLAKTKVAGSMGGFYVLPGSLAANLQKLLDDTFVKKYTRDRKGANVPNRLVLVGGTIVQNAQNWMEYTSRRKEIAKELKNDPLQATERFLPTTAQSNVVAALPKLHSDVQEAWLWHGTSANGAEGITSEDFRLNLAGSAAGTLYGRGIYLAEACSKSDEYTEDEKGERFLLLCRATMGRIRYVDAVKPDTKDLEDSCLRGKFHMVLGDREKARGTYREFICYDDDQVYPAYIIKYRRQYYH